MQDARPVMAHGLYESARGPHPVFSPGADCSVPAVSSRERHKGGLTHGQFIGNETTQIECGLLYRLKDPTNHLEVS
jgi:hypothetical protein